MKYTFSLLIILFIGCSYATAQTYTLEQLKDSALQNNIAMRKGRLQTAAAKEQRREAFTNYFPNISAVGMTFKANKEMAEMTIDPQDMLAPETKAALAELAPMMAQVLPAEALAGDVVLAQLHLQQVVVQGYASAHGGLYVVANLCEHRINGIERAGLLLHRHELPIVLLHLRLHVFLRELQLQAGSLFARER